MTNDSSIDDGYEIKENGDGDLDATINHSKIRFNGEFGIKAEQADAGDGLLKLKNVELGGNVDGDIDVDGVVVEGE